MKNAVFVLLIIASFLVAAPMESLDDYNVYLIHGTGSRWGGLDCENGDKKGNVYTPAYDNLDSEGYSIRIGGRGGTTLRRRE
jgi:hypothetical protein